MASCSSIPTELSKAKKTHTQRCLEYSTVEENNCDRADASAAFTMSFTGTNVCVLTHFEDVAVQYISRFIQFCDKSRVIKSQVMIQNQCVYY